MKKEKIKTAETLLNNLFTSKQCNELSIYKCHRATILK